MSLFVPLLPNTLEAKRDPRLVLLITNATYREINIFKVKLSLISWLLIFIYNKFFNKIMITATYFQNQNIDTI